MASPLTLLGLTVLTLSSDALGPVSLLKFPSCPTKHHHLPTQVAAGASPSLY